MNHSWMIAVFNFLMCSAHTWGEKHNTSILPKYTDPQILRIFNSTIPNRKMNVFQTSQHRNLFSLNGNSMSLCPSGLFYSFHVFSRQSHEASPRFFGSRAPRRHLCATKQSLRAPSAAWPVPTRRVRFVSGEVERIW